MAKRTRKIDSTAHAATFAEIIAAAPPAGPPVVGSSIIQDRIGGTFDFYLYGNPAQRRMGEIMPVNQWPEFAQGKYSLDTRLYFLFEEMLVKYPGLEGILASRIAAVTARKQIVQPASSSPRDHAVSDFVTGSLAAMGGAGGFHGLLDVLMDAMRKGLSVVEIDWEIQPGGLVAAAARIAKDGQPGETPVTLDAIVPARFHHLWPGHFRFDKAGAIYPSLGNTGVDAPLDPRRLLIFQYAAEYDNPYGVGLLSRLIHTYTFFKQVLASWVRACEENGSPSVIGKYPSNQYSAEQTKQLTEALETLRNNSIAAIPDKWTIEALFRSTTAGSFGEGFMTLLGYLDDQAAKLVSGSTLTSSEGRRSGSMALGKVHDDVRLEKVDGDARATEYVINNQLIRRLVDFNFGPDVPAPHWRIDTESEQDTGEFITNMVKAMDAGLPLPVKGIYEKLKVAVPEEGEALLNPLMSQAALEITIKYGILTKNEVRYRMGLPPMEGGDTPFSAPSPLGLSGAPAGETADAINTDDLLIESIDDEDGGGAGVLTMAERAAGVKSFAGKKKALSRVSSL